MSFLQIIKKIETFDLSRAKTTACEYFDNVTIEEHSWGVLDYAELEQLHNILAVHYGSANTAQGRDTCVSLRSHDNCGHNGLKSMLAWTEEVAKESSSKKIEGRCGS